MSPGSVENQGKQRIGAFALVLLLVSSVGLASEKIYSFDVDHSPGVFGEIFHVALRLEAEPESFVYLPHVSGVRDPDTHHETLKRRLTIARFAREALSKELEGIALRTVTLLRQLPKAPGDGANTFRLKLNTPTGSVEKSFPIPSERELVEAVISGKSLSIYTDGGAGIFEFAKEYPTRESALDKEVQEAKLALDGERSSRVFADFIRQCGLGSRIVEQPIQATYFADGKIRELIGVERPDSTSEEHKFFKEPTWKDFAHGDQRLEHAQLNLPDRQLPMAVSDFISRKLESRLSKSRSGVLLWNRQMEFSPHRNMPQDLYLLLIRRVRKLGHIPVLVGAAIPADWVEVQRLIDSGKAINLTEHWKDEAFYRSKTNVTDQLHFFRELRDRHLILSLIHI